MPDPAAIPASLRAHFRQHNVTAVALAACTLVGAVLFWSGLYFVLHWFTLLFATILNGDDAHMPAHFTLMFAGAAFGLCFIAAGLRWMQPHEQTADRKPFAEILGSFLLVIPRITFAVWGNLSACRFLSEREMEIAWRLLQKITAERQINIQSVAVEIPDPRVRDKIVFTLQVAELVYFKKTDEGFFLATRGGKARELAQPKVRIEVAGQRGHDQIEN